MDEDKSQKLISLLKQKLEEVEILKAHRESEKLTQWKSEVNMILDRLISEESKYYKDFNNVNYSPMVLGGDDDESYWQECYERGLKEASAIINAIIYGKENGLFD